MDAQGQPSGGPSQGPGGAPSSSGAPTSGGAPRAALEAGDEPSFLDGLLKAKASIAFMIAVAAIFYLAYKDTGASDLRVQIGDAIADKFGAYDYALVREHGDWWRFFTTMFVPRNWIAAGLFIYWFASYAPSIERIMGTVRFSIMYLAAGAGAIAFNEIFGIRGSRADVYGDVMVAVYALFGATPGLVLGLTGSFSQMARHPRTTSAFGYAIFLTFITYVITNGQIDPTIFFGMLLGLLITAGLMAATVRRSMGGIVGLAVGGLVVVLAIGGVMKGLVWRDGKLVDRGHPITTARPDPSQPPGADPQTPPPSTLGTTEQASDAAKEVLEKVRPFLDRFGPLPVDEGITLEDRQQAEELLTLVKKTARGTNLLVGELDEEHILLALIASNMHEALDVANEHVTLVAPERGKVVARARALRGVVGAWLGGGQLDKAYDDLDAASGTTGFTEEMPEVLFHYGMVIKAKTGDEEGAKAQFQRYLRVVADGPQPEWRKRIMALARARAGM
jgi:membrane associated rhomboid family serine protease